MAAQINPTRMELQNLKRRLKTASRGHKLLKDKRDEMVRRFVLLARQNKALREQVEGGLADAMKQFAAARAGMGAAAANEALICPVREAEVETDLHNVMSVEVPVISIVDEGETKELPYSFAFTSPELDGSVLGLAELLPQLIKLAEVEKACNMLSDEIEKTRRRVNALEYIMIPEMKDNIKYITMKLEENERGSQTRLMKVKDILNS